MSDEKKPDLIIDEDWKSQVEREKQQASTTGAASADPEATSSSPMAGEAPHGTAGALPEATLELLVTSLATQAMLSLGRFPHPVTNKVEQDLPQARHLIDLLGVLDEKTRGNRTPDESALLEQVVHDLRMLFVQASR